MKTLIINGSPKGKNGNTEIFINNFISGMHQKPVVKRIIEEDKKSLASMLQDYDSVILAMPLYIHSMPGIVMRFIEHMTANTSGKTKYLGFILQCGFPEGFQCKYIERYFESLAKGMNMEYLGTLIKPESAGTSMMPAFMTKKLFARLKKLGEIYENTGLFDRSIMDKMQLPYRLNGFQLKLVNFLKKLKIVDAACDKFLKDNKAYHQRFDRPFINPN